MPPEATGQAGSDDMVTVPRSFLEACRNLGLSHADDVPGEVPHVYFHPHDPKAGYNPSRVWRGQRDNRADATVTFEAIDRFRSELDAVLSVIDGTDAKA